MHQYILILYYKFKSFVHSAVGGHRAGMIRNTASILFYAGFTLGSFYFSRFLTQYLLDVLRIGTYLFHQYLSMALYVFFLTISMGNMIVSYATLFRSREVGFLLTQPVGHLKVFLLKFLDNFFYSSSTLILVGGAFLFGYGSYFHFGVAVYAYLIGGVLLPFTLLAACIGVLLLLIMLLATRYLQARWLIAIMVAGYLAAVYVYFRSNNPFVLASEVMKYYPRIDEYFRAAALSTAAPLPSQWVSDVFYFCANGSPAEGIPPLVRLLGVAALFIAVVIVVADRFFYLCWIRSLEFRLRGKGRLSGLITFFSFRSRSLWKPQTEVLLKKEYWTFFREPSQWFHMAILLFLTLVFVFGVSGARYRAPNPMLQSMAYLMIYLFNGFLISSMALRFSYPAISLEGETLWAPRSSPLRMRRLLRLKYCIWFAGVSVFAIPLAALSMYPWRHYPALMFFAVGSAVAMSAGFVGLNLGMGGYFADFREKNPVRIASSQGASISFLLGLGLLAVVVGVAVLPIQAYYFHILLGRESPVIALTVIGVSIALLALLVVAAAMRSGAAALSRDV